MIFGYFAAPDDVTATLVLGTLSAPTMFRTEAVKLQQLDDLEARLTGRSTQDIAADPRFNAAVAEMIANDEDIPEYGIVTVTDTLSSALATADDAALKNLDEHWFGEISPLSAVARQAVERGQRVYCLWSL